MPPTRRWLARTKHILPNALVATPDPRVVIMRRCDVFPVEFVVRGYMTGSTATSLWTHYSTGKRQYCGHYFREGYRKNDRLDCNVVTPTTKEAAGDRPISREEILDAGIMSLWVPLTGLLCCPLLHSVWCQSGVRHRQCAAQ